MASKQPAPHILIVEDDAELLEVMKYLLEDEDYRVSGAESGEAALEVARDGKVDLVLLDIGLGKMSGLEVARSLRADPATAGIRIALHSGQKEAAVREQFDGYDLFVEKSEDPEQLLGEIAAAFGRTRAPVSSS
jgi:two-component system phosphate regulon response regulator PhoB